MKTLLIAVLAVAGAARASEWEEDDMVIVEAGRSGRQFGSGVNIINFQRGDSNTPVYHPCVTADGREGRCNTLNKCYPFFRIFEFEPSEQWVMGTYDTCKFQGPEGSFVFGVCCPLPGSKPTVPVPDPEPEKPEPEEDFPVEASLNQDCGKRYITRIVNGKEANPHSLPFMAAMLNRNRQFCGGSLIDKIHILTAAHCVAHMSKSDVQNLRVVLGDHNLKSGSDGQAKTLKVKRVIRHKGFKSDTLHNDVAILTLEQPVQTNENIQPICLQRSQGYYDNQVVDVAGWGTTSEGGRQSNTLRRVDVKVWSNSRCKNSYGSNAPGGIISSMICASTPELKKDSCSGDSGGPLFTCKGNCNQIGIVSWGIGCAKKQYPGVYTRVSAMYDWIDRIVRKY